MKIGRNDLCWCGSGKKYKKCHFNNEDNKPPLISEMVNIQQKVLGKKYCLHPKSSKQYCKGNIVKAHTIQKSGGLSKIAMNGHVYAFSSDFLTLRKNRGMLIPELLGLNLASTFTGFCSYHDTKIFSPIESDMYNFSKEHAFLLAYRAISKELFAKRLQKESISTLKRLSSTTENSFMKTELDSLIKIYEEGVNSGLQLLESLKIKYDYILINKKFDQAKFYSIKIDSVPYIMCSGAIYPDFDFSGRQLQNIADLTKKLDLVTFSSIATNTGGALVLCWEKSSDKSCLSLVKSLHKFNDKEISSALVKFMFSYFENIYFSPMWWDSLSSTLKNYLLNRTMLNLSPNTMRTKDCLVNDGVKILDWRIASRINNFSLNP